MHTGLTHQLAQAFGRNNWTPELVNEVTKGDFLERVRQVLIGRAEIVSIDVSYTGKKWQEIGDTIFLSVTSWGCSGEEWVRGFESQGCRLYTLRAIPIVENILRSSAFKPSTGITYHLAILRGDSLNEAKLLPSRIDAEAFSRKWSRPPLEAVCLVRSALSNQEIKRMDLQRITMMSELIHGNFGGPHLLSVSPEGDADLEVTWGGKDISHRHGYARRGGYMYLVSQEKK